MKNKEIEKPFWRWISSIEGFPEGSENCAFHDVPEQKMRS
ncbi:hypothetical protein L1283_004871 [Sphingobacterium sp. HSC-15S19]